MPTIQLYRAAPLTVAEALALPPGALVETGPELRLSLDLPLAELLEAVYRLGGAVPGCTVNSETPVADSPPLALPTDPWALVEARDPRAEQAFAGEPLDGAGRSRVQAMLGSNDAVVVGLGCQIARWTGWRAGVQLIRRLVGHPSPDVRRHAVVAIGALAGPSLTMTIRPLRTDPDPAVRAAALVVLKQFGD